MLTIARLFGKSPFAPLQTHMKKVSLCIDKLSNAVKLLEKGESESMEKLSKEISRLEHEADLTKNDIRNHLPKSLFLPIDRSHFLEILSVQDSIADTAEEIGISLALRPLACYPQMQPYLEELYKKNIEAFGTTKKIIEEIDDLLESSFGGIGAENVKLLVEQTAYLEHEAEQIRHKVMKFVLEQPLIAADLYLWTHVIQEISQISTLAEKLANRIRMILELK